ncbi:hypothetical protein [Amycolatopsis sp. NPDC059021]|uniref:hypothetical protein n=1 Tax=Amycolatopsis sp. NPDC059021 TaxID=3346704 RepID=UPI00366B3E62
MRSVKLLSSGRSEEWPLVSSRLGPRQLGRRPLTPTSLRATFMMQGLSIPDTVMNYPDDHGAQAFNIILSAGAAGAATANIAQTLGVARSVLTQVLYQLAATRIAKIARGQDGRWRRVTDHPQA